MKLYTKTGDDGSTGLFGGARVPKCDARVAAYGDVDETNAAIGIALALCKDDEIKSRLTTIQSDLFVAGAELATQSGQAPPNEICKPQVAQLEAWIDLASAETPPLRVFVLPGGSELSAHLHFARTVCRRAERSIVSLSQQEPVGPELIIYLNRLSDLLFAWARLANHRSRISDIPWIAPRNE